MDPGQIQSQLNEIVREREQNRDQAKSENWRTAPAIEGMGLVRESIPQTPIGSNMSSSVITTANEIKSEILSNLEKQVTTPSLQALATISTCINSI